MPSDGFLFNYMIYRFDIKIEGGKNKFFDTNNSKNQFLYICWFDLTATIYTVYTQVYEHFFFFTVDIQVTSFIISKNNKVSNSLIPIKNMNKTFLFEHNSPLKAWTSCTLINLMNLKNLLITLKNKGNYIERMTLSRKNCEELPK